MREKGREDVHRGIAFAFHKDSVSVHLPLHSAQGKIQ